VFLNVFMWNLCKCNCWLIIKVMVFVITLRTENADHEILLGRKFLLDCLTLKLRQ